MVTKLSIKTLWYYRCKFQRQRYEHIKKTINSALRRSVICQLVTTATTSVYIIFASLPPLGHIWDVMLVWRKGNINRTVSATVVSAEPFSHGTGTLRCLQKEMATYRHWSVSLWRDPDDVPHCRILSPDKTEWRLISATLCGWRCYFVADQLWLMTRIREEEDCYYLEP